MAGLAAAAAAQTLSERHASRSAAARASVPSPAVEQMLRADTDKDGAVSRKELERLDPRLVRRFKAADRNRDGKLNLAEFERLRAVSRGATGGAAASGSASGGGAATAPH